MKKSIKVVLLDWGSATGSGGASTGPHGIITLGIGLPENDLVWFFTSGLNIGAAVPPPAPAPASAPTWFVVEVEEEPIAVEPDSVFVAQPIEVEEEYTGRVLWSDMRVPGEPNLWDRVVTLVKQVFK